MITPRELKDLYSKGENISQFLRSQKGLERNDRSIIEASYDLQAGSYVASMSKADKVLYKKQYTTKIAEVIQSLCQPRSLLEAGVGEATTLSGVIQNLDNEVASFGFDLCWSRIAYAQKWLSDNQLSGTQLFTGDLFNIPLQNDSIEVVYTSHSMEPNGGMEKALLEELYRVTGRYLVLLEPGYDLANPEARARMESHGYCTKIHSTAMSLGYKVISHELFPVTANPLNPTALTIIEKSTSYSPLENSPLACPRYKTPLEIFQGALYSREALVAYPVLQGIPCLRIENGIMASHFEEFI